MARKPAKPDVPTHETIVAAHHALMMAVRAVLPQYVDDVQRDFGVDKYDEMLSDYQVGSDFDTLKLAVLDDGWRVLPAVAAPTGGGDDALNALAARAKEIADFVSEVLAKMDTELLDACAELLDACGYGHKVAEVVWADGRGKHTGRLVVKAIKVKPNKNVAFLVDEFANVIGIVGATKDKPLPPSGVAFGTVAGNPTIGRDRAIVFTNSPKDADPRGRSLLRLAYSPWFFKKKVIPEWFKYLQRFGTPSVVGTVGEMDSLVPKVDDATGEFVQDGNGDNILVSAQWALREELMKFVNGLVMALPPGYKVDLLQATGEGKAFTEAVEYCDRAISRAILGTAQMTQEAQHESRSSKQVGQDVASLRVSRLRHRLGNTLTHDLVRPLVLLNFGEDALDLMPSLVFSDTDDHDFATNLTAVSGAYASGLIHDSQLPEIDVRLGLPTRDMDALRQEKEDRAVQERLLAGNLGKITRPLDDDEDGEE